MCRTSWPIASARQDGRADEGNACHGTSQISLLYAASQAAMTAKRAGNRVRCVDCEQTLIASPTAFGQLPAHRRIAHDRIDGLRQQEGVRLFPDQSGIADGMRHRRGAVGHDGHLQGHRFHHRNAKSLMLAGQHKRRGTLVIGLQLGVRHAVDEQDAVKHAQPRCLFAEQIGVAGQ